MKRRIRSAFLLGAGCIGVLVGCLYLRAVDPFGGVSYPSIDVDRHVWLGKREMQERLEPSIAVNNRGRQPLLLHDITTSCGCLGVFLRQGSGERAKVDSEDNPSHGSAALVRLDRRDEGEDVQVEILPHGSATLILRLTVGGTSGVPTVRTVQFRTNDPSNPVVEIALQLVPIAHYTASPVIVALGTVPVGDRPQHDVEITAFDRNLPPISRVVSSDDRVRADYQPTASGPGAWPEGETSALIGRLRVTFQAPPSPADVTAVLSLYTDDRREPVLLIPVTARVTRRVELVPGELVLPRSSGNGPVYTANCLCRAAGTAPLTLEVREAPPGITVRVHEVADNPSLKVVRVDATRLGGRAPIEGRVARVGLNAEVDGRHVPLVLTLTIRPQ